MSARSNHQRGFTLIASLILLALLSGLAIGLMYMVNGSQVVGANDLASNTTYYAATSGMEQLTVSLANLYESNENPSQADLSSMANTSASSSGSLMSGTTFYETATWTNGTSTPTSSLISEGQDAGLTALLVPVTLTVTATSSTGASISMTRGVDMAFIPVFQFGVFSQSDLSYFAGPPFTFAGRVHTNGNLFLASDSGPLVFGSKVTAVGQIIRDQLANGHQNTGDHRGPVYIPNQTSGCDSYIAAKGTGSVPSHCVDVGYANDNSGNTVNDASWSGGYPTGGSKNSSWPGISTGNFNSFLANKDSTGVQAMELPFVNSNTGSTVSQNEIIREPETTTESTSSPLGASREFNKANIRILLADTEAELHPDGSANDANDVQLYNTATKTPVGVTLNSAIYGAGKVAYFAVGSNAATITGPTGTGASTNPYIYTGTITDPVWDSWNVSPSNTMTGFLPFCGASLPGDGTCTAITGTNQWPLVNGWLRVEYYGTDDAWHGVTNEWLSYGFIQDPYIARTSPGADTVGNKDAILILQQLADRDGDGAITNKTVSSTSAKQKIGTKYYEYTTKYTESTTATGTATNFYPINLYDAREGFPRDSTSLSGTNGYTNGIMNVVEIDVGNLQAWLGGTGDYSSGSGTLVNDTPENGYLVYFSDRRGMWPDPNAIDPNTGNPDPNILSGESGLEDVINSSSSTGMPDGALDPQSSSYTPAQSPEDVDDNNLLDNWGATDIGWGFGVGVNGLTNSNEFLSVNLMSGGRQNLVTGARHALKLVDGGMSSSSGTYLPLPGFTVASENPVYVQGNYNSDSNDSVWTSPYNDDARSHSAAAIIADAVTFLSNSWTDLNSMENPTSLSSRTPSNTYYRMAIAAGKNMNFPVASVSGSQPVDFGTDGGAHNFLRMLENWGGKTVSYRGSIVSLYYSQYATGTFKCCSLVYGAPTRNFFFDTDFLDPTKLPPGTPQLEDVVNLSYHQSFTPCTTQSSGNCTN